MDSGIVGFSWASAVTTTLAITITVRHNRSNLATAATFNPAFLGMSFLL